MGERRRLASAVAGLSVVAALAGCTAPPATDLAAAPGAARDVDGGSRSPTRAEVPDRGTAAARPDARPRSADGPDPGPPDRDADETVAHAAALERAIRDCRSALVSLEGMLGRPEPSPTDLGRADQRLSACTSSLTAVQTRARRAGVAEPDVRRAVTEVRQVLGTVARLGEELTRIADTQPQLAVLVRDLDRGIGALRPRPATPRPGGRG